MTVIRSSWAHDMSVHGMVVARTKNYGAYEAWT